MKRRAFKVKTNLEKQKKLYLLLIGLAIIALIFGIIFIFLISEDNVTVINENLNEFFGNIDKSNKWDLFSNSITNNLIYIVVIWLLGMSVIGLPLVVFIYLFKFFIFGFSLSSIICTYKIKGILKVLFHLFPHQFLFLIIILLVSCYSITFSVRLFNYLFFKKNINFREVMNKYLRILFISIITSIFISLYEVYISTYLLNLLN